MKIFESTREIPASPDTIFAAFEQPQVLARWWGPSGFANTFEAFEFRPDGQWKFVMHGPDGKNYPNESRFAEISRPSKIVIRHAVEPLFTLTVRIVPSRSGSTVHWTQEFEREEVANAIAHIVQPANEQNLDRLVAVLAGSD